MSEATANGIRVPLGAAMLRAPSRTSLVLAGVGLLLTMSICARYVVLPVQSEDYIVYLSVWSAKVAQSSGLTAFSQPVWDYTPAYIYILKLLTFIPITSLFGIKAVSSLFDLGLAAGVAAICADRFRNRPDLLAFGFVCVLACPTVMLNSALWGQCDSVYTFSLVVSLFAIVRDKPRLASLAFGVAISFKLQAIFFAPVLGGYLLSRRAVLEALWIPTIFVVSCIPALAAGGPIDETLLMYLHQMGGDKDLTRNAPSIYSLLHVGDVSPALKANLKLAGLAVGALVGITALCFAWRAGRRNQEGIVLVGLWCVLTIPFVLPHMHERYFYVADVFAIAYALLMPRRAFVAMLVVAGSGLSYIHTLAGGMPRLRVIDLGMDAACLTMTAAVLLTSFWLVQSMLPIVRRRLAQPASDLDYLDAGVRA